MVIKFFYIRLYLNEDYDIPDKMVFKSNQAIFQCNVSPGHEVFDLKNQN